MTYNLQNKIQSYLDNQSTLSLIERLVEYTDMGDTEMSSYIAHEISKRYERKKCSIK